MRPNWTASQERIIRLPDHCPSTFAVYQDFMYSGRISSQTQPPSVKEWSVLVDCYALGQQILDSDFKDAIVDAFIEKSEGEEVCPVHLTKRIYDATPKLSPLRQLIVAMHKYRGSEGWFKEKSRKYYNEEAMFDICKELMSVRGEPLDSEVPPYKYDSCIYHEHEPRLFLSSSAICKSTGRKEPAHDGYGPLPPVVFPSIPTGPRSLPDTTSSTNARSATETSIFFFSHAPAPQRVELSTQLERPPPPGIRRTMIFHVDKEDLRIPQPAKRLP